MEILSNRISATPRSKYIRYGYGDTYISGSSGSANVDLSNYVKLTGETEQTIEGNVLATGDLIAYSTGQSTENYPIASATALGMIKVGKNLTIDEDGTLNAQAGGVSNWNEIQGKPTLLTDTNIKKWDDNSHTHLNKAILDTITADSIHTHSNKANLDSINQNLGTTNDVNFGSVKATGDIIAYSTGQSTENYPIASSTALGCIKVGNNLSITSDGTLSAQAGGVTSWNELKDKPTTLAGYGITDAAKASDLTSHTGNTTVHITATERTNWNDANSKKHTHSNKSYLDVINQNLATTSNVTFAGVKSTGDVVAYSTGTAAAPFKYWKPSVSADGNLSWTNSTSETVPDSVNIKGAAGDASKGGLINGLTWLRNPSSGSICYITGNAVSGYTSGSPNLWINWSPNAVASGTSCSYSYRTFLVGGKSQGTAILAVNEGNNGAFTGNYGGSSDIRLKENIVNVDNVLSALENIDIFKFNYKNDETKQIHFGVSAQKVNEYYPELITYADNDEYGKTMVLKYIEFNTLMAVGGVKELHALVKSQQAKIDELEQRLAIIESNNNTL